MALVITLILFALAFMVRCYEVLHEEAVDNLSSVSGRKNEEYDTFFAEELEYLLLIYGTPTTEIFCESGRNAKFFRGLQGSLHH